jgi:hypothetical protein
MLTITATDLAPAAGRLSISEWADFGEASYGFQSWANTAARWVRENGAPAYTVNNAGELRVYRMQTNGSVKSVKYAAGAWQVEAAQ